MKYQVTYFCEVQDGTIFFESLTGEYYLKISEYCAVIYDFNNDCVFEDYGDNIECVFEEDTIVEI